MVLAAGLGTRLRPLTEDRPKALVTIGSRTLLDLALARLRAAGVSEVIVNVHHFAELVIAYLKEHKNFGMRIEISREQPLLDTGGGVKKAAWFFLEQGADEPFLVHNVDVLSSIDLSAMVRFHLEHGALATLAVQERKTSRPLLFDAGHQLCGRGAYRSGPPDLVRPATDPISLAFAGIHVLSPRIFSLLREEGAFPIVPAYLRLAAEGEPILGYREDAAYWRDLGRLESLRDAKHDMAEGIYAAD
jgi:NDP-sugar pyrophosphorylase family protein